MTEEKRANQRRETCNIHEGRDEDIGEIKTKVNRQDGQWRILLLVLVFFMLTVWENNHSTGKKLDALILVTTDYQASHRQESLDGFRRIITLEEWRELHTKVHKALVNQR